MNRAGSLERKGFLVPRVMLVTTVLQEALDPQVFQVRPSPTSSYYPPVFVLLFCDLREQHHVTMNCLTNPEEFCLSVAQYPSGALFLSTNKEVNSCEDISQSCKGLAEIIFEPQVQLSCSVLCLFL